MAKKMLGRNGKKKILKTSDFCNFTINPIFRILEL